MNGSNQKSTHYVDGSVGEKMILRISSIDEDPGKQSADFRSLVSDTRNKKKLSLSSRALYILRHLQKMKQKIVLLYIPSAQL